jgi:hypothetical protein
MKPTAGGIKGGSLKWELAAAVLTGGIGVPY